MSKSEWSTFGKDVERNSQRPGVRCKVADLLEKLPDESAVRAVKKALANKALSAAAIEAALRERMGDEAPTRNSIGSHRRGACRCPRD